MKFLAVPSEVFTFQPVSCLTDFYVIRVVQPHTLAAD